MSTPPLDGRLTTPPPPPLHHINQGSQDGYLTTNPTTGFAHPYQCTAGSPSASSSTTPALGSSIDSDEMSSMPEVIRFPRLAGLIAADGRVKATPHVGDLLGAPSELARRTSDSSERLRQEELGTAEVFPSFMTSMPSPYSVPLRLPAAPFASPSLMGPAYHEMLGNSLEDVYRGHSQSIRSSTSTIRPRLLDQTEGNSITQGVGSYHTQDRQGVATQLDSSGAGVRVQRAHSFNQESSPPFHVPERVSHPAVPITPAAPMPTPPTDRPMDRTSLAFGLTGHHLRDLQRDPIAPPIPTASSLYESSRSALSPSLLPAEPSSSSQNTSRFVSSSTGPSVPPPRPSSRSMLPRTDYDRLDFSPSLGEHFDVDDSSFRQDNLRRSNPLHVPFPPDRQHLERLQRLDTLRTSGERHMFIHEGWSPRYAGRESLQQPVSRATDTSSRLGRYNLDEQRDLRSRVRRPTYEEDEQTDLSRLHRTVQDAIGRRVSGDAPHSPTSLARRHREITAPYPRPPSTSRRTQEIRQDLLEGTDHQERTQQPYSQPFQISRSDEPVTYDLRNDGQHGRPLLPVSFGWEDSGAFTDPVRTLSRHQRNSSSYDHWLADSGLSVGWSDTVSDSSTDIRHDSPRSLSALSLRLLQICPSMNEDEQVKIARNIVRAAKRFPESVRKQAVKSAITSVPWMSVTIPGVEKDACCSICHDDYENLTMIGLTPCNHMYHEDCLSIWLNNRETYSCPMCRRDLGVYTLITQLCPALETEDILKIWMAI